MDITPANLEDEMRQDEGVIKYLEDMEIAIEFYQALCNMQWKKTNFLSEEETIISKLKGEEPDVWSCSWRYAGGIVASIRSEHHGTNEYYMDFYCTGFEGVVSHRVEQCFNRMGWVRLPYDDFL